MPECSVVGTGPTAVSVAVRAVYEAGDTGSCGGDSSSEVDDASV